MASPYDFMIDPSASAQAAALEKLMRQRKLMGLVGQLSGDRVLTPVGRQVGAEAANEEQTGAKQMWQAIQTQALRQREARDAERFGIDKRRLDLQERALAAKLRAPAKAAPVGPPEPTGPSPKRYLGEYLTPAAVDLTDAQRNDLLNTLAVPGAQWLDQMAELSATLEAAGDAPTPDQLADIQRLIAAGTVKLNKVAGLGALSGPDIEILRKAGGSVGDLTNFLGQATGLRDLKASVRSAAERGARDIARAAGAYGSKPVEGQILDFAGWDKNREEYLGRKRPKKEGAAPKAPKGAAYYSPSTQKFYDAQGNEVTGATAP